MKILICAILALAAACGGKNGGNQGGDGGTDGDGGDGGTNGDAQIPVGCTGPDTSKPQCSNCIDDDSDGFIDSFDLECTGSKDNDESSFETGIPGDNMDAVKQDCFFDGDSGAGNDGCNIHVCCLLGAMTVQECTIGQNQYNPMDCPPPIGTKPLSAMCIDVCGDFTPPGCDCFGCCTLCNPNNPSECYDIATNPNTSPGCTAATISDPAICKRCTKVTACGSTDCGMNCVLCPGQTPDDLPPECNMTPSCPAGTSSCANGMACPPSTYCESDSLCCVGIIL